jgi:RNA polymerase sigma factor (sigma-70 family)
MTTPEEIIMGRAQARVTKVYDREALMVEFAPLIKFSVEQIQESNRLPLDREDLIAAALTGLFEALKHFDPSLDRDFRSFAERSIRRAIWDEVKTAVDFFHHVHLQPIGPAEAVRHHYSLTQGYDWKGHKYKMH